MLAVNKTHQGTLEPDAEGTKAESTGKSEGKDSDDGNPNGDNSGRVRATVWLSAVKAVSDLTKYNWKQVFEMSALEFFVFLEFNNYLIRKQEAEIRKLQKHK